MTTDLTFITNENGKHLKDRFEVLIKDARLFDCLVGYFYTSGFHAVYRALENTEKIRILVGIATDKETHDLLELGRKEPQLSLQFSHAETKHKIEGLIEKELEESGDARNIEDGITKFIEWIRSKKMEIVM